MAPDSEMEQERLALLARLRAQREMLVEQIDEATKLLAEVNKEIAILERDLDCDRESDGSPPLDGPDDRLLAPPLEARQNTHGPRDSH